MSQVPFSPEQPHDLESCVAIFEENREAFRSVIGSKIGAANRDAVDDILQEIALAASAAKVTAIANPKSWLRQVLNHKVADFWRKEGSRRRLTKAVQDNPQCSVIPPISSPYEWVLHLENRENLSRALIQLPEEDRELLKRKYLRSESCKEISVAMGISTKALEYRLDRARKNLRKQLNELNHES